MRLTVALAAAAVALMALAPQATAQRPGAPGSGKPVVGGGSFNTAPLLRPGTYNDTAVTSGETTYYRVELAKGQRLEASAEFDSSGFETSPSKPGYIRGLTTVQKDVKIFTPLRQEVVDADTESTGSSGGIERESARGKLALGYEQLLSDYTDDDFYGPGSWYIGVSTDPILDAQAVAIPVTLRVKVSGTAQRSDRNFAGRLIPIRKDEPDAPAVQRVAGLDLTSRAGGDEELSVSSLIALAAFALAGGLLLGAVAGLARRRGR